MVKRQTESGFSALHPLLSFLYFIVALSACLLFKHPIYLYTMLMIVILLSWAIDGGKALNKSIKGCLLLAFIIFIANPLFTSRGATILFYIFDRSVTLESIVYGAQFALSLLSILLLFVSFNLIVTPDKFLFLFGSIAPRSAFIVTVTLRFVPLLKRRLMEIMAVQKAQGGFQKKVNRKLKLKEGMETLHTLITWSLEEALMTANSMRARGYGIGKRSSAISYQMERTDVIVMSAMIVTGVILFTGAFLGLGQYEVYPKVQQIPFSPAILFHYINFSLFLLIPIMLNGKVWLQWRIIKSKM